MIVQLLHAAIVAVKLFNISIKRHQNTEDFLGRNTFERLRTLSWNAFIEKVPSRLHISVVERYGLQWKIKLNSDKDSLLQRIKRENYQSFVFSHSCSTPSPFGCEKDGNKSIVPVMFSAENIPCSICELQIINVVSAKDETDSEDDNWI